MKNILFLVALAGAAPAAALPRELTEEGALAAMAKTSPELKAARAASRPAQQARKEAGLYPNPELSLDRDALDGGENSYMLEWAPDLWGRRGLRVSAAEAGAAAALSASAGAESLLRARVRRAFYALLSAQEISRERREAAARVKALAGIARGSSAAADYARLRLEVEFASVQAAAAAALAAEDEARCSLSALLGETGCAELLAVGELRPSRPSSAAAAGPAPSLAKLEAEVRFHEAERKAALKGAYPELGFRGGLKTAGGESGAQAGVSLTLPFLNTGAALAGVKAAERDAALAALEAERLRLAAESQAAGLRLERLLASVSALASGVAPQAARLERSASLAYAEGQLGAAELVDAFKAGLEARLALVEAAAAARLAEIDLRLARGE